MGKPIKLQNYVERRKAEGSIAVDLGKEHGTVNIPPIEVWPDEAFDTAGSGDTKAATALVLGDEAGARFYAAGGNWRMLSGIVRQEQGLDVGESEASSES